MFLVAACATYSMKTVNPYWGSSSKKVAVNIVYNVLMGKSVTRLPSTMLFVQFGGLTNKGGYVAPRKLIYGVGVNDVFDTPTQSVVNGKLVADIFYATWSGMLRRCYSGAYHKKYPTYIGCEVCDDWVYFSRFKSWMQTQDYIAKQLDKDLLFEGNKVYSPETCVFVSNEVNSFMLDHKEVRGSTPIGVHYIERIGKFAAQCRDPEGGSPHLGVFTCPDEAHKAYKMRKSTLALILAKKQNDVRVADVLISRYTT